MAAGVPSETRFEPGTIVKGVTDLTTAFPYGGTELGRVREVEFNRRVVEATVDAEEFGGFEVETSAVRDTCILAVNFRGFDADVIDTFRGGSATGGASGGVLMELKVNEEATRTGKLYPEQKIMLVPKDRTNGIFLYLPAASLLVSATEDVQRAYPREFGQPAIFRGVPNASGYAWQEGKITEITL